MERKMDERLNALVEKAAQRMEAIDTTKLSIPEIGAFLSSISYLRLLAWPTVPSPYEYGCASLIHNDALNEKQKED